MNVEIVVEMLPENLVVGEIGGKVGFPRELLWERLGWAQYVQPGVLIWA